MLTVNPPGFLNSVSTESWRLDGGRGGAPAPLPLSHRGCPVCICFPKVTVNRCGFNVIVSQLCLTCSKQETRNGGPFPVFPSEDLLCLTLTGLLKNQGCFSLGYFHGAGLSVWVWMLPGGSLQQAVRRREQRLHPLSCPHRGLRQVASLGVSIFTEKMGWVKVSPRPSC